MDKNVIIRLEKKSEERDVENLIREAFWNVYRPGCLEHFAHLASYEEVSGNDYNLSVSTYVEAEDAALFYPVMQAEVALVGDIVLDYLTCAQGLV